MTATVLLSVTRRAPVSRNIVPETGTFMQIVPEWMTKYWIWNDVPRPRCWTVYKLITPADLPVRNPTGALPATVPMIGLKPVGDFAPMNEKFQNFWFDLMGLATGNTWGFPELAAAWLDVTQDGKAMTDDHAWSHNESRNTDLTKMFREYVTGKNLATNTKDMAIKSLHMVGNLVKIVGADTAGNWIIETLDPWLDPPDAEWAWERPWLTPWLTQTTVDYRVIDWPQLGPHGVPFPVVGIGGRNRIPKAWCRPVENGAEFTPYLS